MLVSFLSSPNEDDILAILSLILATAPCSSGMVVAAVVAVNYCLPGIGTVPVIWIVSGDGGGIAVGLADAAGGFPCLAGVTTWLGDVLPGNKVLGDGAVAAGHDGVLVGSHGLVGVVIWPNNSFSGLAFLLSVTTRLQSSLHGSTQDSILAGSGGGRLMLPGGVI